uniref:Uncharacterized protein n=1 Tax=Eptatretus burgeri TaxID=7764 RepID=A0A8C4QWT7_EPTBU
MSRLERTLTKTALLSFWMLPSNHCADASGDDLSADASGDDHSADASGDDHRVDASGDDHRADASGDVLTINTGISGCLLACAMYPAIRRYDDQVLNDMSEKSGKKNCR